MIKIFLPPNQVFSAPLKYILAVFSQNQQVPIHWVNQLDLADISYEKNQPNSLPIAENFYQKIAQGQFGFRHHLNKKCQITTKNREVDWLATAFYYLNALQEYNADKIDFDQYGRFKFSSTYQYKFQNHLDNLVQTCFDNFAKQIERFVTIKPCKCSTKLFLSHDIDLIHGSLRQDGIWAIKNGRPDLLMKIIVNELLRKPHWLNMDNIMQLHEEYGLKSTFFWLVEQGRGAANIKNSDANPNSQLIDNQWERIQEKGFDLELHKSTLSKTFAEELKKMPENTVANRYHFLKFQLPQAWEEIENSGLKLDASLGFTNEIGFRNSYGLPFRPYNFSTQEAYNFVEVPLHIMDGVLWKTKGLNRQEMSKTIMDFIDSNRENCVLSILWHNTEFSEYKYKDCLAVYRDLLIYCKEMNLTTTTPKEIIEEYGVANIEV